MAVNDKQFNAQQERVQKIAESYEGSEKKEVAELYVERIAKIKSAIMESQLSDNQKEEYLTRLDNYLKLVDANNIQRLRKEYEPLLKSMESTLNPEVKEQAQDDRDAKLEGVADLKIRQELLGEWREATKFKEKYESKKQQLELLIKTKKLEVEGTELQYFMTSIEFHTDFFNTKFKEYYETKDVGQKHEKLKDVLAQGDTFFEVLTALETRLKSVNGQDDLQIIDLNDRNVLAEQAMFIKQKRYAEAKATLFKQMDDMKIPKDDGIRKQVEMMLQAADMQFDSFKEDVLTSKTPEERTVAAEAANKLLDQANSAIEGAQKWLKYTDYKNAGVRSMSLVKILESQKCPTMVEKFFKTVPFFIMPQFAVGLGYYHAAHQGGGGGESSTADTALEVADFGISLVPIAGGVYDIFASIRGKTLSGRQMGTVERVVRGVIGVGSIVLDVFTFGVGGTLAKAGGKAALKAGAEITAKATAKAALEAGGKGVVKVAAKEGAEVGGKVIAKEAGEVGAHAVAEGAAKEAAEVVGKEAAETVVEGAAKEASKKVAVALTEAQKEIIFKGTKVGASAAERSAARSVLKELVHDSLKASAKELGAKQAAKLAEQTAKIATRKTTGLAGFGYRRLAGLSSRWGQAGAEGLEKGIIAAGTEKASVEAALKAGKQVVGPYYLQARFVTDGEVLWGGMAKSVGKDAAKAWWHMHNPMEVLRALQTPGKFLTGLFKRYVKGIPGNMYMGKAALAELEQSAKATLIADGHDAKAVDALFVDVKEKPWQQVMKENENNPMFKDPELVEFFKSFQEQFPKSLGTQFGAVKDLYAGFKELEPDALVSAKMAYDSRRMEWKDFYSKYKDNLRNATPEQLRSFEEQFSSLHSMDREMPVNVARIKEERAKAKEVVALSKEQAAKLQAELDVLKEERAQIEEFLKKYSEGVAAKGRALEPKEQVEMVFEGYKKLPDGQLKKSVDEARDKIIKDSGIEVKADSEEFMMASSLAMRQTCSARILDIDSRIAVKAEEVGVAAVEAEMRGVFAKNAEKGQVVKKPEQKEDVMAMGERRAKEAEEAVAAAGAKNVPPVKPADSGNVASIETAKMAKTISQEGVKKSVPQDLADVLSAEQLRDLKTKIEEQGRKAVIRETQKLGPQATEAEMREAGKKAFDQAARQEIGDQVKGLFHGMADGLKLGHRAKVAEYVQKGRFEEAYFTLVDKKLAESIDRSVFNLRDNNNGTFTVIGVLDPKDKKWIGTAPAGAAA